MAEETMKDFEKELEASYKDMDTTEDPEAGKWEVFEKMLAEKTVSKVKVTEIVKGGCIAFLDEVRAFIPASQLSTQYVENLDEFLGQSLEVVIITVEPAKKRLVLSHRAIEKEEAKKERQAKFDSIKVGEVLEGKVDSIKDYGAFIDLGDGISGLLHVSQISNQRVKNPAAVLKEGDEIEVKVVGVENGKISLSKKVLEAEKEEKIEKKAFDGFKNQAKENVSTSLADLLKNLKTK